MVETRRYTKAPESMENRRDIMKKQLFLNIVWILAAILCVSCSTPESQSETKAQIQLIDTVQIHLCTKERSGSRVCKITNLRTTESPNVLYPLSGKRDQ